MGRKERKEDDHENLGLFLSTITQGLLQGTSKCGCLTTLYSIKQTTKPNHYHRIDSDDHRGIESVI